MLYLTLDTCVWLDLLKASFHTRDNLFEEVLFHIEKKHIICITTQNITREWNRNKLKKRAEIINHLKSGELSVSSYFKENELFRDMYQPEKIEEITDQRIARLDQMFSVYAEEASETPDIYIEAAARNLNEQAPNHREDSYRDTINILSIIKYILLKGYDPCYFVTINHKDFSTDQSKKHELHPGLTELFSSVNLQYMFFEDDIKNYAGKFKNTFKKHFLPSYTDYLKEQNRKAEEKKLEAVKETGETLAPPHDDSEFLENIKHLDIILQKKTPTSTDGIILEMLFKRHEGYRQYFMHKVKP